MMTDQITKIQISESRLVFSGGEFVKIIHEEYIYNYTIKCIFSYKLSGKIWSIGVAISADIRAVNG